MLKLLLQVVEYGWHMLQADASERQAAGARMVHAQREFWEIVFVYGRPHIIGQVVIGVLALALYPTEFSLGALAGAIWAIGDHFGKG